jgi:tetratricopeptide (TPR) repeat protein
VHCRETDPHLAAYIDGELEETLRDAVETHLKECRACRETVRDMRLASSILGKWKTARPTVPVVEALRERLADEKELEGSPAVSAEEAVGVGAARATGRWIAGRRLAIAASILLGLGAVFAVREWAVAPRERSASQRMAALGRVSLKVTEIEDLPEAEFALDGVIAEKWTEREPNVGELVQLEVVAAMMQIATDPRQSRDVGRILEILAGGSLATRATGELHCVGRGVAACVRALLRMPGAAAEEPAAQAGNLLDEAVELEENGELEAAVGKYRLAAENRLVALRALLSQANIEMKLGRSGDARQTLQKAYEMSRPDTFSREIVDQLMRRLDRAVKLQRKIDALKAELLRTQDDFELLSELGNLQVKSGNLREAIETFSEIARVCTEDRHKKGLLRVRLIRVWCSRELNRYNDAFDEANRLIADAEGVYPDVVILARQQRAKILQFRGRHVQAIDDYRDLAENTPGLDAGSRAAIQFQVGYIYLLGLQDEVKALESFKALDTAPYRAEPFGRLAVALVAELKQ